MNTNIPNRHNSITITAIFHDLDLHTHHNHATYNKTKCPPAMLLMDKEKHNGNP